MLFASFIVFAAFAVLYFIVNADIPGTWKFAIGIFEMFVVGQILIAKYSLKGEYGIIMLRTKKGLQIIRELAKSEKLWNFFADSGLVVSYGALSFFLMKKHITWKSAIVGFVVLIAISMFVVPFVLPFLAENIQGIMPAKSEGAAISKLSSFVLPIGLILLLGGGFFAVLLFSLLFYGVTVLYALISTFAFGTTAISQTSPGATLLLPGINLPFVEGILALVIILIVHEGAHAVLGRIAKVPILSSGIVLFGVIPVGAFVEPDEEFLKKVERTKQTRVLVAGSAANMFTSLVFFILFIGFLFVSMPYRETGLYVISGTVANGTIIHTINGMDAANFENITLGKNAEIVLGTNNGEITLKTNNEGKMGISFYVLEKSLLFAKFKDWYFGFIYMVLGLVFSLNFVIGSINLLPLPFFDGHRIMELNIKNQMIVKALMYVTIAGFVLNIVPHFFR